MKSLSSSFLWCFLFDYLFSFLFSVVCLFGWLVYQMRFAIFFEF